MRLLIITQTVDIDDDNLGFFHGWLEKFAGKLEELYVICLRKGNYEFPGNVKVYSMGKEKKAAKIKQFLNLQKNLIQILPRVDGVFVHMCPIYAIASFPLVKFFKKKMFLWYVHRSVSPVLKIAEMCVDKIFTASEESCRLKDRKKIIIAGHGIDTDKFKIQDACCSRAAKVKTANQNSKFEILSAGRISPIKDQKTLIEAVDMLVNRRGVKEIEVKFVGSPLENYEKKYFEDIKNLALKRNLAANIKFLGGVPYSEMPQYYQNSDLVVNLSHTGSIDKTVLEAIACGCLVLTCNEAFFDILGEKYLFKKKNAEDLAEKIIRLKKAPKDVKIREIVVRNHNLNGLIDKIISEFNVFNKRV